MMKPSPRLAFLCIGETLEEFEKELVNSVCEVQLKKGLAGTSAGFRNDWFSDKKSACKTWVAP